MKTTFLLLWLVCMIGAGLLEGQTVINGSRSILGAWDASAAASTKPIKSGTSLPATCSQGEFFFHTAGQANRRLYACALANTWEQTAYKHGTVAQIPVACDAGQIYFATNASAGTNLYFCTTAGNPGTWTQMSAGVTSAFGRVGAVIGANNDYSFSQISGTLPVSVIAEGSTGTGAVARAVSPALTSPALTTPSFSGAISGNFNFGTNAALYEIANASTTGTGANLLAKLTGSPATAVTIGTSDSSGIAGVCLTNCGLSGNAQLALSGRAACQFDGATTAGDYVQPSASAAGKCHDVGATYPSSGQVIGRVLSTNAVAGTYAITVFFPGIEGGGGGGASSSASYTTINNETTVFQNSRQWQDGTSTKVNTSTAGKIAVDENPFDRSVYTVIEEWLSGNTNGVLGALNWRTSNNIAAPTISYPLSENQHPGILRCAASANNTDVCQIFLGTGIFGLGQKAPWKFQALVRIGSTTTGKYFYGLSVTGGFGHVWALYDSTASVKWRFDNNNGSNNTVVDSTVTAVANTWHLVSIEMLVAGTVRYSIDNETPITLSTNVPGATTNLHLYHQVTNTTAASNYTDLDWTAFQITGLTR